MEPVTQDWSIAADLEHMSESDSLGTLHYIHDGVDVIAPLLTQVKATVGGTLNNCRANFIQPAGNFIEIAGNDGRLYTYLHITPNLQLGICCAFGVGTGIGQCPRLSYNAGDVLGNVILSVPCLTYSHLHYGITEGGKVLDPAGFLRPYDDESPPQIDKLHFCPDDAALGAGARWDDTVFATSATLPACTQVWGDVDAVVQIDDTHMVGASPVPGEEIAPLVVKYRACGEASPDCTDWKTLWDFSSMDPNWGLRGNATVTAIYSGRPPFESVSQGSDLCLSDSLFFIPTNAKWHVDSMTKATVVDPPKQSESWKTKLILDGFYSFAVEASDSQGNATIRTEPVCVANGGPCSFGKLLVRDCSADTGAEPSACADWWDSPDVIANPTSTRPDTVPVNGKTDIQVCMTNVGCAPIPAATPISVAVDWAYPSAYVPHPIDGAGGVAAQTPIPFSASQLTSRAGASFLGDWSVAQERCTTLTWTPNPADPYGMGGHYCLVGRASMAGDAPTSTSSVWYDNNRAQKNVQFVTWVPRSLHHTGVFNLDFARVSAPWRLRRDEDVSNNL